jgi:multiple sugar transport system substrate-binding protein
VRGIRKRSSGVSSVAVVALAGGLLAGCGSQSGGGAGVQLTWYINPDGGGSDPTKGGQTQLAAECTKASGGKYTISTQLLPNSASDQRQQLLRRLAAADPGVDLMSMDPVFVAEFAEAQFLAPVPQERQAELTADVVKPMIEAATWKQQLVAAPMWANTQLLWYRKSVAQAAGIDMTKPVTWQQIIDAAASQKKTIGVQAKRYEGYMVWVNALIEGAGGHIIENPGATGEQIKLGLESPAGKAGTSVIQQVVQKGVGGPAISSGDETAALDLFAAEGTAGFLVNWPYTWAALPEKGVKMDDIGYAKYPQTVQGQDSKPPIGGIELGVNRASQHQKEAWDAVTCITSPEHQKLYMLGTGNPAAKKAVFDDAEIKQKFPMATLIRDSLDAGAPRPLTQYYGDVSTAVQREYSPPEAVDANTTPQKATDLITAVLKGEALL